MVASAEGLLKVLFSTLVVACCSGDGQGGRVPGEVDGQIARAQRVGARVYPGKAGQAQAGQLQAAARRGALLPG